MDGVEEETKFPQTGRLLLENMALSTSLYCILQNDSKAQFKENEVRGAEVGPVRLNLYLYPSWFHPRCVCTRDENYSFVKFMFREIKCVFSLSV